MSRLNILGSRRLLSGRQVAQAPRGKPLNVSGVGKGSQTCAVNVKLPVAIKKHSEECINGSVAKPTVANSSLPGLLGLASLRASRAVIDGHKNRVYVMGTSEYELASALQPGTDTCQHLTPQQTEAVASEP